MPGRMGNPLFVCGPRMEVLLGLCEVSLSAVDVYRCTETVYSVGYLGTVEERSRK